MKILPHIIGLMAVATFLLSYQPKKRKNIILMNNLSRCLYILQYALLGAYAGVVLNIVGAIYSFVAGEKHRPFVKKHIRVIQIALNASMIIVGVLILVLSQKWYDIFPLVGILLHTNALWMSDEKKIRIISLVGCPFWFAYNAFSRAYGGCVGDVLTVCSIIIAMIRHRELKEEKVSVDC